MKFAYADPPYVGQAKKHYKDMPDYAGEVDHAALIAQLVNYDAWALSCHSNSLRELLALAPSNVRVGAWVKPFAFFKPGVAPKYCWEPVIYVPGRTDRERRKSGLASPRDYVSANVWGTTAAERAQSKVKGRKPPLFCEWLFDLLGAGPGDEFTDMFPGSGAVGRAWKAYVASHRKD